MDKTTLKHLKEQYPEGSRVELIHMDDPQAPKQGAIGVVRNVDDIGTVHVAWENGSSLGLIPGVDEFRKTEGDLPDRAFTSAETLPLMIYNGDDESYKEQRIYEITCVFSEGFESGRESLTWHSTDPEDVIAKAYKHYAFMFNETEPDDVTEKALSGENFGEAMSAGFSGKSEDYVLIQGAGCHLQYEAISFTVPSLAASPAAKEGRWLDSTVGDMPVQVCDRCNTFYPLAYTGGGHAYCPSCGAKMVTDSEEDPDCDLQELNILSFTGNKRPDYVIECDSCGNTSAVCSDHKRYCPVCGPDVITPIRVRKFSNYCKEACHE